MKIIVFDYNAAMKVRYGESPTVIECLMLSIRSLNGLMYDLQNRIVGDDLALMRDDRDRMRSTLERSGYDMHLPDYEKWHSGEM